ncbi:glycosyltransferase [Pseudomonadota bacterium]
MLLSVIIPTHNRAKILKDCLKELFKQSLPKKNFEIIVVDDGSRDETKEVVKKFMEKRDNIKYVYQKNQGQGIARNKGMFKAEGDVVVFMGDDIIPTKDFLSEHMRYHLRYGEENEAVLGLTMWHPKLKVTPFMKWLTNGSSILGMFGGHQFAYEKLKGKVEADFNFFYTSNISLKFNLADKYPFDPSFSGYGWEDIELGYRLHKREGLRIYYNPKALGYHFHKMSEKGLETRMKNIGAAARIIDRKYPELQKVPSASKQFIFFLISNPLVLGLLNLIRHITGCRVCNFYYYALSKKYFLEGLHNKA